jgi:hypothetical protein
MSTIRRVEVDSIKTKRNTNMIRRGVTFIRGGKNTNKKREA